jgi:hypothetical protein
MTTKTKKPAKIILIIAGVALVFVWPIIIASFSGGHLFLCNLMSSSPCVDRGNLSDMLGLWPAIIGGLLLSVGLIYNLKQDRSVKLLITLGLTVVFSLISYWSIWIWFWLELWLRSL